MGFDINAVLRTCVFTNYNKPLPHDLSSNPLDNELLTAKARIEQVLSVLRVTPFCCIMVLRNRSQAIAKRTKDGLATVFGGMIENSASLGSLFPEEGNTVET
jgi:hypothetical protein